jgi:L-amino acid N-acyltransferase YncA
MLFNNLNEALMQLRDAQQDDAAAIVAIYNHYVLYTAVSFEEEAVHPPEMAQRIADVHAAGLPWVVLVGEQGIVGYAYATRWRVRHAYRYSVETTVYLAPAHTGAGGGTRLYTELLARLRLAGYHLAIGGIALPNAASVALHEKLGFLPAARFSEVGFKAGQWIDVGYWQAKLAETP